MECTLIVWFVWSDRFGQSPTEQKYALICKLSAENCISLILWISFTKYLFSLCPSPRGCELWMWKSGGRRLIRSEKQFPTNRLCELRSTDDYCQLLTIEHCHSNFPRLRFDRKLKTKRVKNTKKSFKLFHECQAFFVFIQFSHRDPNGGNSSFFPNGCEPELIENDERSVVMRVMYSFKRINSAYARNVHKSKK